jgi:hypothetical protein
MFSPLEGFEAYDRRAGTNSSVSSTEAGRPRSGDEFAFAPGSDHCSLHDHRRRNTMGSSDDTDFPKLAAPARRALAGAGYLRLEQLAGVTEADLMQLHGMGATTIDALRDALAERGLSFRG